MIGVFCIFPNHAKASSRYERMLRGTERLSRDLSKSWREVSREARVILDHEWMSSMATAETKCKTRW